MNLKNPKDQILSLEPRMNLRGLMKWAQMLSDQLQVELVE
uniref:Uncharacterized protein n=1 Tax=Rhizophora mucronata TaxID=61149 RepID=A0A2P2ILL6_RHIMU